MQVTVYMKPGCGYSTRAMALLQNKNVPFEAINIENDPQFREQMEERSGARTTPQIFIGDTCIGGCDELLAAEKAGQLDDLLQQAVGAPAT